LLVHLLDRKPDSKILKLILHLNVVKFIENFTIIFSTNCKVFICGINIIIINHSSTVEKNDFHSTITYV